MMGAEHETHQVHVVHGLPSGKNVSDPPRLHLPLWFSAARLNTCPTRVLQDSDGPVGATVQHENPNTAEVTADFRREPSWVLSQKLKSS